LANSVQVETVILLPVPITLYQTPGELFSESQNGAKSKPAPTVDANADPGTSSRSASMHSSLRGGGWQSS
jgi:hypothetical protein